MTAENRRTPGSHRPGRPVDAPPLAVPLLSTGPLGTADVERAEAALLAFHRSDLAHGGGRDRRQLAAYLAREVLPRLRRPGPTAVRLRMYQVAGQLAYLCGFMHIDDHRHEQARRYYATALRLATLGGVPTDRAVVLRGMSVRALALGDGPGALDLAWAATRCAAPAGQRSFLLGQLAVALARNGARHQALRALTSAERFLDRATGPADAAVGVFHQAALLRQEAAVRELLGDLAGAVTALQHSLPHRPPEEVRSYAIVLTDLAVLLERTGHLTEATATWHDVLDLSPHLSSARVDRAVTAMRARLRPNAAQPAVHALLERTDHRA
ncbi:hypothetical protein Kpho02_60210 [Kitasatospora phosalacinea]|uniref:Uncharacterized protein n=1 Tax=Kitasatospora phosalacinea TaxID=2065 RepID=A0A9W6QEX5_9ACTN|nr:hypothetical protein [Kitasatospora phosalacinea]GLW73723.1 hypothetical protein Kpho02_60210 [Kitasatospora phosalacinea]